MAMWYVYDTGNCTNKDLYYVIIKALLPGKFGSNLRIINPEHILHINFMGICEMALGWMLQNTFDDRSTLFQVITLCCQAINH